MSTSDPTPPATWYSCEITLASLARITASTSLITSGEVSFIVAMRSATSAWVSGGSDASTSAARVVCRLAIVRAIVCGASLRRNAQICSGGVRRRNSNGRISITADRRPIISAARTGPTDFSSTSRAYSKPPWPTKSSALVVSSTSVITASVVSAGTWRILAISSVSASISSSWRWPSSSAARSGPSDTSRTAAFWRPLSEPAAFEDPEPSAPMAPSEGSDANSTSVLLVHPGADLMCDALGLMVDQLLELGAHGVGLVLAAGEGHRVVVAVHPALELRERRGRLDLAQPHGLPQ